MPLAFHNHQNDSCLDLGSPKLAEHRILAEKERLAEDIRLAYVALTRARARVYLVWGEAEWRSSSRQTALAWLFHHTQSASDLERTTPDADLSSNTDLMALIAGSSGDIDLIDLPEPLSASALHAAPESRPLLEPEYFSGRIAGDWRVTSFSGLTRDIHQVAHKGAARSGDEILDFPAGSHVGLYLHAILEELDFGSEIAPQAITLHDRHAARYGLEGDGRRALLTTWLSNIIRTPLLESGLCLAMLAPHRRLNELAFDFSVSAVSIRSLNQVLAASALASAAVPVPLDAMDFRGLITGIIDLIFEYEGRFYIADYKSNFLGGALSDYMPSRLERAILDRRYDLQYLIYTVALQRYLRQRLPDYDYDRHFGGVFYLFVRGMRPELGPSSGVWFDRPDRKLVEMLDDQIFVPPVKEGERVKT